MRLSRRAFVKAGGIAAASMAAPVLAETGPVLVVYDSRIPASRRFARSIAAPALDVAKEDAKFWRTLRGAMPQGRVAGLTSWSDLVIVRGFLEEKGKRLSREERKGRAFVWEMA